VLLGGFLIPRIVKAALRLRGSGLVVASALMICFVFSFAAARAGLAPIVGAFAAGLVLEPVHYQNRYAPADESGLEELLAPITSFLVPIFFVLMGMRVELLSFTQPKVVGLALALTLVGIVGKQACGLGVGRGVDRLSVGIGMIPRGEVGLIFASIGAALSVGGRPLFDPGTFSALVMMVILTTLATPPLLRWSLARSAR
jgi:Kef-type K+ transport system membrane component KefB